MLTIFSKAGLLAIIFAGIFYVRITDIAARNPVWSVNAPTALEVVSNRTCGLYFFPRRRYSPQHTSIVPELRLNGRWLEKAGFDMACYASITVMDGLLIIRSAKEDK